MKILPIVAFLGLGTVGVGGWYKFHNLKPNTLSQYLEWQGLRLISGSESNYWKAVLSEGGDAAKKATKKEFPTFEDVRDWCKSNLNSVDYEDLKVSALVLCVDNPKTVRARIIQLDGGMEKLMKDKADNQYKVAYVFRKHISGFNALIGYQPKVDEKGKEVIDLEVAAAAFQKWCTGSLEKPVDETLALNIRELCTPKSFSKVREYLNGRKLLTFPDKSAKLKSVWEKIKDFSSYKADIGGSEDSDLKKWCKEQLEKDFSSGLSVFEETLPKVISRCVEGSEVKEK